jgi:hypothetical protein
MMSQNDSWHRKICTDRHFQHGRHNTAHIQHCSISTSWIDSRHWKISTGLHFQNVRHNTAKIQHCSISKVVFKVGLYLKTLSWIDFVNCDTNLMSQWLWFVIEDLVRDSSASDGFFFDLLEPWDVRELYIRKTVDLPM